MARNLTLLQLGLAERQAFHVSKKLVAAPDPRVKICNLKSSCTVTAHSLFDQYPSCSLHTCSQHHQQAEGRQSKTTNEMLIRSLQIPSNDVTQRLEQAFQLIFQSPQAKYCQLCKTFKPLGGLPRAWLIKGESGSGIPIAFPSRFLIGNRSLQYCLLLLLQGLI